MIENNKVNSDSQENSSIQQKPKSNSFDKKRNNKFGNKKFNKKPIKDDFEEKVVAIRRVTKVTKGGRHFRFAAVVVVGNKKGLVGMGTGKANEVPEAIKKAIKNARKDLIKVSISKTTVPHEILGTFGAGKILIKPARLGTGVIAGGPARMVLELAGISDVYAKSLGTNNPINMIRATLKGLNSMQTLKSIRNMRYNKDNTTKENTTNKEKTTDSKKETKIEN